MLFVSTHNVSLMTPVTFDCTTNEVIIAPLPLGISQFNPMKCWDIKVILGALGASGGPECIEFVDTWTGSLKFPVPMSFVAATWKLLT